MRNAACDLFNMTTMASKMRKHYYFQSIKALSSSIMPAGQASELIPAYQHIFIWFSTVRLDHARKVYQIILQKGMNSHQIFVGHWKKALCETTENELTLSTLIHTHFCENALGWKEILFIVPSREMYLVNPLSLNHLLTVMVWCKLLPSPDEFKDLDA